MGLKGERGKVVIFVKGFDEGGFDTVEEGESVGFEKLGIEDCEEDEGGCD